MIVTIGSKHSLNKKSTTLAFIKLTWVFLQEQEQNQSQPQRGGFIKKLCKDADKTIEHYIWRRLLSPKI